MYHANPARHLITPGEDLDDLSVNIVYVDDISDLQIIYLFDVLFFTTKKRSGMHVWGFCALIFFVVIFSYHGKALLLASDARF